jgi:hypothetical protein
MPYFNFQFKYIKKLNPNTDVQLAMINLPKAELLSIDIWTLEIGMYWRWPLGF